MDFAATDQTLAITCKMIEWIEVMPFKIFLIFLFAVMAIYTGFVLLDHGPNFLAVFLTDLFTVDWRGQFNLDFATYLLLSAIWIAWRHRFSSIGLILAGCASIGGMLFFAPYLLFALGQAKGDLRTLLLGNQKVKQ